MKNMIRVMVGGAVLAMMVMAPLGVGADDPEPTPSPVPTKVPAKRPKTLSDLAGGIKLQQSEEKKDGVVVIDNANLKAMGEGAVVSEGKASGAPVAGLGLGVEGADDSAEASPELMAARREIQRLEEQLETLNDASGERQKANMYTGAGPQYRPPGVGDPLDTQIEKVQGELQAAKERAKALERKAKRDRATNPPKPSSSGSGG